EAVGAHRSQLPEILASDEIGGKVTREAARQFGLAEGTPMLAGIVDGSASMLLAGAKPGQLTNSCGSTDVLALCTAEAKPHPRLLTRPVGIKRLWVSVSTIAAAGSALSWAKQQFFPDHDWPKFDKLMARLARVHGRDRKHSESDTVAV